MVNKVGLSNRRAKEGKIRKLGNKIIEAVYKPYSCPSDEVYFFPEYNGVKGYLGTQEIIFLGLNPSKGNFPSKADEFFYKQLLENGFSNAHLTDLTKLKIYAKNLKEIREHIQENRHNQINYLLEEIRIIEPKIIVLMGNECKRLFEKCIKHKINDTQIAVYAVPHYFQRGTEVGKRKLKEFEEKIKNIRQEFKNLNEKRD